MAKGQATREIPTPNLQGLEIPPERIADPQAHADSIIAVRNLAATGTIQSTDAHRRIEIMKESCEMCTGVKADDIFRERRDPLVRFEGLLESGEHELLQTKEALRQIDRTRLSEPKKKRWLRIIDETIELQNECRKDYVKAWVYIGRTSEKNEIFKMSRIHLDYFDVWNNPDYNHSLVMAPPGHGKTVSMRGQICCELGDNPELRCLILTDTVAKAKKEVILLKAILRSGRYRAMFPDVRILKQSEGATDTNLQFTVTRVNILSREPSIEGAAIGSQVNGSGYDRIFADDVSPPEVRHHITLRQNIEQKWTAVIELRLRDPENMRIRMICTPWHEEDLAGVIMRDVKRGQLGGWLVAVDQFRIKDDANGDPIPIWDKFSVAWFKTLRFRLGSYYQLVYGLTARRSQDRVVTRLRYYPSALMNDGTKRDQRDRERLEAIAGGERWLSIDPAASSGDYACDTGIIDAVLTINGYAFITGCEFKHSGAAWMQNWIINRIYYAQPRYFGIHIEAQAAFKGQVNLWIVALLQALKEGQIPQPEGDDWKVEQQIPYGPQLKVVTPGTNLGRPGQPLSKRQRLAECSSYLQNGIVRLAGERVISGHGREYLRPIPSSSIDELARHVLDFDNAKRLDGIDALTQWILVNSHRMTNPNLEDDKTPVDTKPKGRFFNEMQAYLKQVQEENERKSVGREESDFWSAEKGMTTWNLN